MTSERMRPGQLWKYRSTGKDVYFIVRCVNDRSWVVLHSHYGFTVFGNMNDHDHLLEDPQIDGDEI